MMKSIASRKAIAARAKNALKIGSCFLSNTTSISKCNNEKNAFLDSIEENDSLRFSTIYSLAMSSAGEFSVPPLPRNLNEMQREQLRISRTQYRSMATRRQLNVGSSSNNSNTNDDDDDDISCSMAYSLSFASSVHEGVSSSSSSSSSIQFPTLTRPLNDREIEQLRVSENQLKRPRFDDVMAVKGLSYRPAAIPQQQQQNQRRDKMQSSLPRSLRDALRPSSEAIVITESAMPFKIYNVNGPWEGLCGYSYAESKGKSLGSLLSGKETDSCSVTALIHQLFVHGEEATTILTNYTKEGRKFRNRLRVGPIYDENTGDVSHFIGVLKEVSVTS